jgi:mevalonate kinase
LIKVSAPGRCGLVGNPTDLFGGSVISCSTRERAQCLLENSTAGPGIELEVLGQSQVLTSSSDLALTGSSLDYAKSVLTAFDVDPADEKPFRLDVSSAIAINSGLGGSTAVLTSIVGAMLAHLGVRLNPYETAELVRKIEFDVLRKVYGFANHYTAVFGGLHYLDFREKSGVTAHDESSPFATVEPLGEHIGNLPIVVAQLDGGEAANRAQPTLQERWAAGNHEVIKGVVKIAQIARLAKKALLAEQWEIVGALMNDNHQILRDLGCVGEITEKLVEAAKSAGAIGAKATGAVNGGTVVALSVNPDETIAALQSAGASAIHFPAPGPGLTVEILV